MPNQNHRNIRQLLVSTRHHVESFASRCEKNRAGVGFKLGELSAIPCIWHVGIALGPGTR
jgi:hypothetical protein